MIPERRDQPQWVLRFWWRVGKLLRDDRWAHWWPEILSHHALGAFAGVLMVVAIPIWQLWLGDCRDEDGCGEGMLPTLEFPAVLLISLPLTGMMLMALAMSYQWAGWIRHKEMDGTGHGDTLRRDIRDHLIGFIIGVVPTLIVATAIGAF